MKFEDMINKVVLGDCLKILPLIPDNSIDLVVTDPPFNISQDKIIDRTNIENKAMRRKGKVKVLKYNFGDWDWFNSPEEYLLWTKKWAKEVVRVLKPNGTLYSFFAKSEISLFEYILKESGMHVRCTCVWHKTNPVPLLFKVGYMSASEFFVYATKNKGAGHTFNYKLGQQHNVFTFPICMGNERIKDKNGQTAHATQKPLQLIELLIKYSSNKNDIILDPFLGSGTTAVASVKLGRKCIGIEINEVYVRLSRERILPYLEQTKLGGFKNEK